MKFILIVGPQAVGKMTVGYQLSQETEFKLFHNHATIDMLLDIFEFDSSEFQVLNDEFRRRIFEEVVQSDLSGLIFTFVCDFSNPKEVSYIDKIIGHFSEKGVETFFVELSADFGERLRRNETEFRLSKKPSKRDVVASKDRILKYEKVIQGNSEDGQVTHKNYLKIDNTNLSPEEVVAKIKQRFNFV